MQVSNKPQVIQGLPRFNLIINYSAREKKFSIPLPPFMAGPLGQEEVTGDTQVSVESQFNTLIEKVKTLERKTSKVIIYDISVKDDERSFEINFQAAVANESTSTVGGHESISYEILPSTLMSDFRVSYHSKYPSVPYSPAMEQWFSGIRKSLLDVQAQLLANGEFDGRYYGERQKFTLWAGMKPGKPK